MFDMADEKYVKELRKAYYWAEEDEMCEIIDRVRKALNDKNVKGEITFMGYLNHSFKVNVYVNNRFFGIFDYIKNKFE